MSKISNQTAYPALNAPQLADYLVITDFDNKLKTKTVNLNTVKNLFEVSYNDISIEVSAAEMKALLSVPKTLIPAPGAGKVLEVFSILAYLDYGGVSFDFGDPVQVLMGVAQWANLSTSLVNASADDVGHFQKDVLSCPINTAITLQAQNSNATVGNSVFKINIRYRTVDLQNF